MINHSPILKGWGDKKKKMENYVVIKEDDLNYLLSKARISGSSRVMIRERTFPASDVFEAARETTKPTFDGHYSTGALNVYPTYTDYEQSLNKTKP